jgi:hypothetical protein
MINGTNCMSLHNSCSSLLGAATSAITASHEAAILLRTDASKPILIATSPIARVLILIDATFWSFYCHYEYKIWQSHKFALVLPPISVLSMLTKRCHRLICPCNPFHKRHNTMLNDE